MMRMCVFMSVFNEIFNVRRSLAGFSGYLVWEGIIATVFGEKDRYL